MKKYLIYQILTIMLTFPIMGFSQFSGPENSIVCKSDSAYFIIDHSSDYNTFQWMESDNGTGFSPVNDNGIYSGADRSVLKIATSGLTVTSNEVWKYFRCEMTSTIYGDTLSEIATLIVNNPPVVDFTWLNPCQYQPVQFKGQVVSSTADIVRWSWRFGDGDTSVYMNPSHVYAEGRPYEVTLIAQDENGCVSTPVVYTVNVFKLPETVIIGKELLCSGESNVEYTLFIEDPSSFFDVDILWNIEKGNPDDESASDILVSWESVDSPEQVDISVKTTYYPDQSSGLTCIDRTSKKVLLTTYKAPPEGEVIQKPYASTVLIYRGAEVSSFQWGYTYYEDGLPIDSLIPAEKGGNRFYCDFMKLDTNNRYWVETTDDSRVNCATRSYLDNIQIKETRLLADLKVYPVPSFDVINIRIGENIQIKEVHTYNIYMQHEDHLSYASPVSTATLYLDHYKSGVYILHVKDTDGNDYFSKFFIDK